MILYEKAYAKINLSLDIVGRRPNGYHEVRMIMQTLDLCDELSFETSDEIKGTSLVTDSEVLNSEQSAGSDNLIIKAVKLLEEETGKNFDVKITLSKNIPIAAGLAGGSADAAATLRGINRLFSLNLSMDKLREISVKIGADVPFCIEGGLCLSEGIGEVLTPLTPLASIPTVICKPNIFVSTKDVYTAFDTDTSEKNHPDVDGMLDAIKEYSAIKVTELLSNILEPVTKAMHPVIGEIEEKLVSLNANKAIMSGSGPTVFGLFNSEAEASAAAEILKSMYPVYDIHATKFRNAKKEHFE